MSILREWRAVIRRSKKEAYVAYVRTTGIAGYRSTPGNLGAIVVLRDIDSERSEIVTLSWWTSLDAIRAFAEFLLTRPDTVQHYESSEVAMVPVSDKATGG